LKRLDTGAVDREREVDTADANEDNIAKCIDTRAELPAGLP